MTQELIADLAEQYGRRPATIAKWLKEGMSLQRIELCLRVQEIYGIDSVATINAFIGHSDYQNDPEALFGALEEFREMLAAPASRPERKSIRALWKITVAAFDQDVSRLLAMIDQEPERLAELMGCRLREEE